MCHLSVVHTPLGCGLDFGVKIRCSLFLRTGKYRSLVNYPYLLKSVIETVTTIVIGTVTTTVTFISVIYKTDHSLSVGIIELPFYPNVVPAPAFQRRCFASISGDGLGKILSHSVGHSVVKVHSAFCPSISSRREGQKYQCFWIFLPTL